MTHRHDGTKVYSHFKHVWALAVIWSRTEMNPIKARPQVNIEIRLVHRQRELVVLIILA